MGLSFVSHFTILCEFQNIFSGNKKIVVHVRNSRKIKHLIILISLFSVFSPSLRLMSSFFFVSSFFLSSMCVFLSFYVLHSSLRTNNCLVIKWRFNTDWLIAYVNGTKCDCCANDTEELVMLFFFHLLVCARECVCVGVCCVFDISWRIETTADLQS